MKENFENRFRKGFTLIESLVSTAIFIMLAAIVYQTTATLIRESGSYRENTTLSGIADQYLEVVRNLPYSKVGTINGNPNGPLPDLANAATTTINNTVYQMYYAVSYVDDPSDGTALAGTDAAPNDYKQIKFYIKNNTTGVVSSFLSNVAPKGLESLASGGALSIKVINSLGLAVPFATVTITNTAVNPHINVTRITDTNGAWVEVGLPNSSNSYHVVATKAGYSSDQTYPIGGAGGNNPVKPDSTILNGQVTAISFSIDQLSSINLHTVNLTCSSTPETGIGLHGSKLIGTSPNIYKYNNSNLISDSSGNATINSIDPDTYTPSLTTGNPTATGMFYGSTPIEPVTLAPNTTQQITLVYGPKTTYSLLVLVKDSVTSAAITTSTVKLTRTGFSVSTTTSSGGPCPLPGQAMFSNLSSNTYTVVATSTGYTTQTINNVSVTSNGLLQILLTH